MRAHLWKLVAVLGIAAMVVLYLLPHTWVRISWYDAFGLVSAGWIVIGVVIWRPPLRLPWYLIAAGQALAGAGDIVQDVSNSYGAVAFFTAGDVLYLASYPVTVGGLWLMVRVRSAGDRPAGSIIDASILASSFALLSWVFFMKPAMQDSSLSALEQHIALAYPAMDVVLLAMLVRLIIGFVPRPPSVWLLVAAVSLMLTADVGFGTFAAAGYELDWDSPLYVGWLGSYVAFACAALHPSMRQCCEPPLEPATQRLSRGRFTLLVAASLIAPALLGLQDWMDTAIDATAIAIASAVLFSLVMARVQGLVTILTAQTQRVAELARMDGLTGVPNRRTWDGELPVGLDVARRRQAPVSVAMIDMDHFKRFNDEYGHQAGDRLLKGAVAAWRSALRPDDLLCRYGGEEFVVLLPGAGEQSAVEVIERLRRVTPLGQTFSAGVACWDGSEPSEQLVERADRALYTAKANGRDRVVPAADAVDHDLESIGTP